MQPTSRGGQRRDLLDVPYLRAARFEATAGARATRSNTAPAAYARLRQEEATAAEMKESCVCCQAAKVKATGVDATLVLLLTLTNIDGVTVANIIEALCKRHGALLDRMVFRDLVGDVKVKRVKRSRLLRRSEGPNPPNLRRNPKPA
jgi:hypothetical protein